MILDEIVASVRARLPAVVAARDSHAEGARTAAPVRDLGSALLAPGLGVIAEVKRRSPSAGDIAPDLDPVAQARRYEAGGAAAVSVLTEPDHFGGSMDDLAAVRAAVGLPVLRKDFTIDPAQVWEARAAGADAVLLIAAILGDAELEALLGESSRAGLTALVEVHTVDEAKRAVAAGATVVGVNNRDLMSFTVDLGTAERLAAEVADIPVRIAESGVTDAAGAGRMAAAGYHAVLVGEALVRADDPAALISDMAAQ